MPPVHLPFELTHPLQPAPVESELRARGPIHPVRTAVGDAAWLVTGYKEVRELLDDDRLGRSHPDPANASRTGESAVFGGPMGNFDTERIDNSRMRGLLRPHFTRGRMRALIPHVEELTRDLLDRLDQRTPPADLVEALALPLPIAVICALLGVPYEDRERFRAWSQAAADKHDRARSEQGLAELFEYGRELVARKSREPGDDVLSRLAGTDGVSADEAAMMGMFLLFAGHETTVVAIGFGVLMLLAEPEQWRAVHADPGLLDSVVEETLRARVGNGDGIPRYARSDLEVAGVPVRAGDLVLLDIRAANHDESVFANSADFDVTRQPADHLSFGHGARYCIGAPLARIELRAVLAQLIPRFPDMRLATRVEELTINRSALTGGLTSLPVTW
ncbi:cytochrome P450 [Lipingzhangella halophila]|nr:cytochrome P450 [Lipingzhangella halophila]